MDRAFSPEELARYGRHIRMPEVGLEGQRRLGDASVILVGAGGLGSPAALYLAAAGVGRLGLVDHDAVELSNLQRQILHDTDGVGSPKLSSAKSRLHQVNPHVEIETYYTRLTAANALDVLRGWDFVIDGSDNFPTRYLVNDACVMLGTPFAYGAILRFEGQASVFGAHDGPCYRCLFREPPPPELVPNCAEAGVLGVLPGIVGSMQACEAIKYILGIGDSLAGRLLLVDALRMEFRMLEIRRDPECAVCGDQPSVTSLIDYDHFCGVTPREEKDAHRASPSHGDRGEQEGVQMVEIDVHELKRRADAGEDFQLVDVREEFEWGICNLEGLGARLIPLATLPETLDTLDPDRPLIIHCRTGPRGDQAVEYLKAMGFDTAVNLAGGILRWGEVIDPTIQRY